MKSRFRGSGIFVPERADPQGLVAVGGALTTRLLVEAYSSGVFPWSSEPLVTWWSPNPRAIFDLPTFQTHRSVRKRIRQSGWTFSVDRDFVGVMKGCAEAAPGRLETWISSDFLAAYTELHRIGVAHSVEVWEKDELIGGAYGVALGGFFGGESMFRRRPDASKAALGHLVERLVGAGFTLLDAQVPTEHLLTLGAIEISRIDYLDRLERALRVSATFPG